jgi:hypothetical protein
MQPVFSPISRISRTSATLGGPRGGAGGRGGASGDRRQLAALVLDRAGARPDLLDEGGRDAAHARLGEIPSACELKHRQPVTLGIRSEQLELLATGGHPSGRAEGAVIALGEDVVLADVVVEQAAVVDDAGDQAHIV